MPIADGNVRLARDIDYLRTTLAIFVLVSFALAWAYVLLYDALLAERLAGTTAGRIAPYLAAWGPLVAVVVVLRRSGVDMRTWFDHQITLREPVTYHLFALLSSSASPSSCSVRSRSSAGEGSSNRPYRHGQLRRQPPCWSVLSGGCGTYRATSWGSWETDRLISFFYTCSRCRSSWRGSIIAVGACSR